MARRFELFIEGWGILIGVPALLCLAYVYPYFPKLSKIPLCGVRCFLGFDCPGCGLTRSLSELVHGNIRSSIDAHPLGIVITLWLIYMFVRSISILIRGRAPKPLLKQDQRDIIMYVFLAGLIIQWIVKLIIGVA